MTEFPVRFERELRTDSPEQVYRAVADLLQHQGYHIRETEPPPPGTGGVFRAGFRAMRDSVLDAAERRRGYVMLAAGVAITVLMLVVYTQEWITNRFWASIPLLPAVLLGAWGLSKFREPAQRVRRVVDTWFEPSSRAGTLHMVLQTGVGQVEVNEALGGWIDESQGPALDTQRLDEVLDRFKAA